MKSTMKCDLLVALTNQKITHRAFTDSLSEGFLRGFIRYSFLSGQRSYFHLRRTLQRHEYVEVNFLHNLHKSPERHSFSISINLFKNK